MVEQDAVDRDHMKVTKMNEFTPIIGQEAVIFSSTLHQKHMIVFTKSKYIILTETRVIQASHHKKQVRFVNKYSDLLGITKSLRLDNTNFIIHFG